MKVKVNANLANFIYKISPSILFGLLYFRYRGKFPNFKKPKNLSEIIFSQILSGEINQYADFVDKVKVREHIKEWGLEEYLPKIYGIWNNVEEIDFDSLPQQFVLKTNNGCGSNYFCRNKNEFDIEKAKEMLSGDLTGKYSLFETQYHHIKPLIFCEELISDGCRDLPLDYKFMCCDGDVRCVLLCSDRSTNILLSTYDLEWNKLDFIRDFEKSNADFECPRNLNKMIQIAQTIAQKFVTVRVDLYDTGDRVYIGELTFTPEGGIMAYYKNDAIDFMGHLSK